VIDEYLDREGHSSWQALVGWVSRTHTAHTRLARGVPVCPLVSPRNGCRTSPSNRFSDRDAAPARGISHDMRVRAGGEAGISVAEVLGELVERTTLVEEQGGAGVAEVVAPEVGEGGPLERWYPDAPAPSSAYASAGRRPSYASTLTSAAFSGSSCARMTSTVSGVRASIVCERLCASRRVPTTGFQASRRHSTARCKTPWRSPSVRFTVGTPAPSTRI
jgi:hypothetical protein